MCISVRFRPHLQRFLGLGRLVVLCSCDGVRMGSVVQDSVCTHNHGPGITCTSSNRSQPFGQFMRAIKLVGANITVTKEPMSLSLGEAKRKGRLAIRNFRDNLLLLPRRATRSILLGTERR